jgi:hypothetical protein
MKDETSPQDVRMSTSLLAEHVSVNDRARDDAVAVTHAISIGFDY